MPEKKRGAFAAYLAECPVAGDVVPESGGIRKVRWGRAGSGKSGEVRVICFTRTAAGEIVLLTLYAKATHRQHESEGRSRGCRQAAVRPPS